MGVGYIYIPPGTTNKKTRNKIPSPIFFLYTPPSPPPPPLPLLFRNMSQDISPRAHPYISRVSFLFWGGPRCCCVDPRECKCECECAQSRPRGAVCGVCGVCKGLCAQCTRPWGITFPSPKIFLCYSDSQLRLSLCVSLHRIPRGRGWGLASHKADGWGWFLICDGKRGGVRDTCTWKKEEGRGGRGKDKDVFGRSNFYI